MALHHFSGFLSQFTSMKKSTVLKIFSILGILLSLLPLLALPVHASLIDSDGGVNCSSISGIFQKVINLVSTLAGIAFFVILVLGGFMYMTAAGNPEGVQKAQQTIIWGLVGTLISVGMVFIATTVIKDVFGAEVGPIFNLDDWICG
jgi:hypothetical protein